MQKEKGRSNTPFDCDFVTLWNNLAQVCHEISRNNGFYEEGAKNKNRGEQIALMHSELSEGLEALRKQLQSDHIPDFLGIEEELADVVIRILDFAAAHGYQVGAAIIKKIEFNKTRSYKHGGKAF